MSDVDPPFPPPLSPIFHEHLANTCGGGWVTNRGMMESGEVDELVGTPRRLASCTGDVICGRRGLGASMLDTVRRTHHISTIDVCVSQ